MAQLVVINLGKGDLRAGFPTVIAQVWEINHPIPIQFTGSLLPAPEICHLWERWQMLHHLLYEAVYPSSIWRRRWELEQDFEIDEADETNVSHLEFSQVCQDLQDSLNAWLNSDQFRHIDQQLRKKLVTSEEIRFIIETKDDQAKRLPWHLWHLFEDYPKLVEALSAQEYERVQLPHSTSPVGKVKILGILGHSEGIDIQKDKFLLEQLPGADLKFLIEPQRRQLNDYLWEQGWDILFFAGHSQTENDTGRIYINQTDSLTINELKYALKKAIERGLRLAIFNSCDGLGLANALTDLNIPQIIVMREPVKDQVAAAFLKYFLNEFAGGKSFPLAFRAARERLQGLEDEFPCASWFPIICQNPDEVPPTWQELRDGPVRERQLSLSRRVLRTALVASVAVTSLVLGMRHLGMLQKWELLAFDQLMRSRPAEAPDSRLLVVTITDEDFHLPEQKGRKGSLSDLALTQLLAKLEQYQPQAIGLDIYRDFPVTDKHSDLATYMHYDGFFAVCKVSQPQTHDPGVAPPPEVPTERTGFTDVVLDSDGVLRRHLLALEPNPTSPCTTSYALNVHLAYHYLQAKGISVKYTQTNDLQLGNVVLKRLREHMGGYQKVDASGYQILLNYHSSLSPLKIAAVVTLKDILQNKVKPKDVKGKIVLIGVTAQSTHDSVPTPYSAGQEIYQELPGVLVQAQMTSQILSAVEDRRPILSPLPFWVDILWIWGWSAVGGCLAWRFQSRLRLGLAGGAALGVLYTLCLSFFIQGYWLPLIPSALVVITTGSGVMIYTESQIQKQQHFYELLSHE